MFLYFVLTCRGCAGWYQPRTREQQQSVVQQQQMQTTTRQVPKHRYQQQQLTQDIGKAAVHRLFGQWTCDTGWHN